MAWLDVTLARLADATAWGYASVGPTAAEPAGLAALALMAHGRHAAAQAPLKWLLGQQAANGGVGALGGDPDPAWPTAWSVLAWQTAAKVERDGYSAEAYREAVRRGVDWLLEAHGKPLEQTVHLGHNASLIGWPWVLGTHSWIEPTALAVLSLKATGRREHARTCEAVRLLIDRLLPDGGCNYGNTAVLGQMLRPHVQPSGLCLWALAGETDADGRIARTREYLAREILTQEATASLSYGLLGLAAHEIRPPQVESLLARAAERTLRRTPAAYRLALLALAAPHDDSRFVPDSIFPTDALSTQNVAPPATLVP